MRRRDEDGQVTLLIIGFASVLLMAIVVVIDASAAYLQRQGLDNLADGAALYGADLGSAGIYEQGLDGERLTIRGELTMRGVTKALEATGTFAGPATYLDNSERISIALETVVNRHDFGVSWNADLPGGGKAVGDDVTLTVDLQLVRS